jgi:hypothetical protein
MSDSFWDCTANYYFSTRFYWGEHKVIRVDEVPPFLPVHVEEGIGMYDVKHEAISAGMFKNDMSWGINLKHWSHGEKTAGAYTKNKKSGIGLHIWPSGAKFIGQFRNNMPNGLGVMVSAHDGLTYVGRICGQDCVPSAPGAWYDKDYKPIKPEDFNMDEKGLKFTGKIKNGKPDGNGILRDILGFEKEGKFVAGVKQGPFIERFKVGPGASTTIEASYKDDVRLNPVKVTKILYGDIFETYEGEMVEGRYEGEGKLSYPNGMIEEGNFEWGHYVHPPAITEAPDKVNSELSNES